MGYKLTNLVHLPLDGTVQLYIFAIGDPEWQGGLDEIIHKNFDNIASNIGGHAVIVGGLKKEFHDQVAQKYFDRSVYDLQPQLPAILITDSHPDEVTKDSLRILIPLRTAHEQYKIVDDFLSDLAAFARKDNDNLLRRLEAGPKVAEAASDIIDFEVPVIPGFVSMNVPKAVRYLRAWWNKEEVVLPPIEK